MLWGWILCTTWFPQREEWILIVNVCILKHYALHVYTRVLQHGYCTKIMLPSLSCYWLPPGEGTLHRFHRWDWCHWPTARGWHGRWQWWAWADFESETWARQRTNRAVIPSPLSICNSFLSERFLNVGKYCGCHEGPLTSWRKIHDNFQKRSINRKQWVDQTFKFFQKCLQDLDWNGWLWRKQWCDCRGGHQPSHGLLTNHVGSCQLQGAVDRLGGVSSSLNSHYHYLDEQLSKYLESLVLEL